MESILTTTVALRAGISKAAQEGVARCPCDVGGHRDAKACKLVLMQAQPRNRRSTTGFLSLMRAVAAKGVVTLCGHPKDRNPMVAGPKWQHPNLHPSLLLTAEKEILENQ